MRRIPEKQTSFVDVFSRQNVRKLPLHFISDLVTSKSPSILLQLSAEVDIPWLFTFGGRIFFLSLSRTAGYYARKSFLSINQSLQSYCDEEKKPLDLSKHSSKIFLAVFRTVRGSIAIKFCSAQQGMKMSIDAIKWVLVMDIYFYGRF